MWTRTIFHRCLACMFELITADCGSKGQAIENCWIRHEWPWPANCLNIHPKISPRFLSWSDIRSRDHLFVRSSAGPKQRLPAGEDTTQIRLAKNFRTPLRGFCGREVYHVGQLSASLLRPSAPQMHQAGLSAQWSIPWFKCCAVHERQQCGSCAAA